MSIPYILPSGQLHLDLVNNAAFVKYVDNGTTAQNGQVRHKVSGQTSTLKEDSERLSRDFRESRMNAVNLDSFSTQRSSASTDGKTVIQNRPSGGLIVETINPIGISTVQIELL